MLGTDGTGIVEPVRSDPYYDKVYDLPGGHFGHDRLYLTTRQRQLYPGQGKMLGRNAVITRSRHRKPSLDKIVQLTKSTLRLK